MVNEKLKEWIKQKRKEGISDQRIKKSLEKTGYDPSIVDEIDDPFDSNEESEPSEDLFSSADEDSERGFSDDSRDERIQNISDKISDQESEKESSPDSKVSEENKSGEDSSESSLLENIELPKVDLPSRPDLNFSMPDVDLPSVNLPSTPDVSKKKIGAVFALLFVIGGVFALYSFIPDDFNYRLAFGSDIDSSSHLQTLNDLDTRYQGCPDLGVTIQNISSSNGKTYVDALTTDEAWVVVEIKESGEIIGFSTEKMDGVSQITVNMVGDEAELRPLGCESSYSIRDY